MTDLPRWANAYAREEHGTRGLYNPERNMDWTEWHVPYGVRHLVIRSPEYANSTDRIRG
jgi:hypothetical protein